MSSPDFANYDALFTAHMQLPMSEHGHGVAPAAPAGAGAPAARGPSGRHRSVLSHPAFVDHLQRQILTRNDVTANTEEVFSIVARVLEHAPSIAACWGAPPLVGMHRRALQAVDEEPSEAAERCYVQVGAAAGSRHPKQRHARAVCVCVR
jgi:hypothetical protein